MNNNLIVTADWSNPDSLTLFQSQWVTEPELKSQYEEGAQCGGCAFFAPFNADFGLCCHAESRHHTETVFEHFTCPSHEPESWGAHSFRKLKDLSFLDDDQP